jgi:hypothetical protein
MFFDNVLKNLCDRATLREERSADLFEGLRQRRALFPADDNAPAGGVMRQGAPELDTDQLRLPAASHISVIVGWFDNESQRNWMLNHGKIVLRLGWRRGVLPLIKALPAATYILLRGPGGSTLDGLFRIVSDAEICGRAELRAARFPARRAKSVGDFFAIFGVEKDPAFASLRWDGRCLEAALLRFANRQRPHLRTQLLPLLHEQARPQIVSLADLEAARLTK